MASITKADLKLTTCKKKVRSGGEHVLCSREYFASKSCPLENHHLLPMMTGFCNSGWHEGTKAVDWKGDPAPSCKLIETCPCECHDSLGKLFALTDSERLVVDASAYIPDHGGFEMPPVDPYPVSSTNGVTTAPRIIESVAPDRVPTRIDRSFMPTPTGRAARGELESWVRQVCDVWLIEEISDPWACTPVFISVEIGRTQAISPPSVGAISSVLERWVKLGFAVMEKKPIRFVKYTDRGIELGLEKIKAEVKRKEQIAKANLKRGIR